MLLPLQRSKLSLLCCMTAVQSGYEALSAQQTAFLHPEEMHRLHQLKVAGARHSYLLGRYAAKLAVAGLFPDFPMAAVKVLPGVFGQPVVYLPGGANLQLSIAHTGRTGFALAFPEAHPMGLDTEEIGTQQGQTIRSILSPQETALLPLISADRDSSLSLTWTMKEAIAKIMRTGLMTPPEIYSLEQISRDEGLIQARFTHFPQYRSLSWISGGQAWSVVLPANTVTDLQLIREFAQRTDALPGRA